MTINATEAAGPADPGQSALALTVRDVSKTYPGTRALREVSFSVERGTTHALLGGNGSGKSTLIKILAGVESADPGGSVAIGTHQLRAEDINPALARRLGLRFAHQNSPMCPALTVAETIAVEEGFPTRFGLIQWKALHRRVAQLIERYEIDVKPETPIEQVRPAARAMIAIARVLADGPAENCVLVLDEPTASLPKHEADLLLSALGRFTRSGETIILVSHRIDEVMSIADAVTVLRDGEHVTTERTKDMTEARLVEHILGRKLTNVFPSTQGELSGRPLLEVSHASGGPLRDVSLTVHEGEILGIAGLLGSGRSTLLRALFGDYQLSSGQVLLDGAPVSGSDIRGAMAAGFAYTPEDRATDAAFPELTLRENLAMANIRRHWRGWRFDHQAERAADRNAMERFAIKAYGPAQTFSSLSGGNQQKVVFARWAGRSPRLLLLDEPTQGVDIGARADIYHSIRAAVEDGMAAVVVSSDFEELAHTCDRVLVLRDGGVTDELRAPDITASLLTELAYSTHERHSA